MDRSGCVVLVPVQSTLEPETEAGLRELSDRGYSVRFLKGASDIVLARSTMATQALNDGFAETFWIDADVVFNPDDVDRIRSHGKPFVAGLYPRKGQASFAAQPLEDDIKFGDQGGLTAMKYVGFGFTYVRREVYEAMGLEASKGGYNGQDVVPYFLPVSGPCYLSEDYAFCSRASDAGFEVLADTTVKLGHVGRHVWTWDDFDRVRLMEERQKENADHLKTISVLRRVALGEIQPCQLQVSHDRWAIVELQTTTVNEPINRIGHLLNGEVEKTPAA